MNQDLLARFRETSAVVLDILDEKIVRDEIAAIPRLLEKTNATLSRIEDRLGDLIDLMRE